jgi:hypothetical protein
VTFTTVSPIRPNFRRVDMFICGSSNKRTYGTVGHAVSSIHLHPSLSQIPLRRINHIIVYGSIIYRTARPPTTAAPRIPQAAVSRATAPPVEDAVVLEVWVAEEWPEWEADSELEPELPLCA